MTLDGAAPDARMVIERVGGDRAFRRRLLELGLVPGTQVTLIRVAPMGDPLVFAARGSSLSIRHAEARHVAVAAAEAEDEHG